MKVFLDCGAHDGCSVQIFRERFRDWRDYQVHCFEPNPAFRNDLMGMAGVTFHEAAVWIEDGERPFYLHRHRKLKASSLIARKNDMDLAAPLQVRCVDLGRWVKANCRPEDHVVMKMDIEGAEYPVLQGMLDDGSIDYIDKLYVEFHGHKTGIARARHQALLADLRLCSLNPMTWRQ